MENEIILNDNIDGDRATYRDWLADHLLGMDKCVIEHCVAAFKAAHPKITQGDVHQAFIDNNINLDDVPPNPAEL